jgi:hypothetical protein
MPQLKHANLGPIKAIKPILGPKPNNAPFLPTGVAGTKMDPRHKFKASREVGYEKAFDQKTDGLKFKPPALKMASIKEAFDTSMYSGPLSEAPFIHRSPRGMPYNPGGIKVSGPPSQGDKKHPDTDTPIADEAERKHASLAGAAAFAIEAIGHWEAKQAAVVSPKSQLTSSQANKAAPKTSNPSGPSIAQISKPVGFGRPLPGATKVGHLLTKEAALKELVRLGLKDVPGTPRLVMRHRSLPERVATSLKVEKAWDSKVTDPLKAAANKAGLDRMPEGRVKRVASKVVDAVASDPVGMTVAGLSPIPGAEAVYAGAKKGLARLIDRVDPVTAAKAAT